MRVRGFLATHRRWVVAAAALVVAVIGFTLASAGRHTEPIDSYAACAQAGYPIEDSYPPRCRANGHTFVGPGEVTTASPQPAAGQDFQILVDGDSGGTYPKAQEVITTQAGWQTYWRNVHASLRSLPPLLPVNFATDNVVALSEGTKVTGGYSLRVTSITSGPSGSTVFVTESIPTITCKVTQSVTNRYFIVRTAKLTAPVNFRMNTEYHHC